MMLFRLALACALAFLCCQGKPLSKRQGSAIYQCKSGWDKWNDSCYKFMRSAKQWSSAEYDCATLGGHLASSNSVEEQTFLENFIQTKVLSRDTYVWIGLSDLNKEGVWTWTDRSALAYTNWYNPQQQPNGDLDENCVVIEVNSNKWFDRPCGDMHKYICQSKPTEIQTKEPFYNCSFEIHGQQCGYTNGGNFKWQQNDGPTGSAGTGPTAAADGHHYMYIETSGPLPVGYTAELISPVYDNKGCDTQISFKYHMHGSDIETLNVKTINVDFGSKEKTVFTRTGEQGNEWLNTTVVVPRDWGKFKLVFEGIAGKSFKADIAIDKVVFSQPRCGGSLLKACPVPPAIKNGMMIYETNSSDVTYECVPGLTLRGYGSPKYSFHCRDGVWDIMSSDIVCEVECPKNRTVTGKSGVIVSPGYPAEYHNNAKCSWTVLGQKGHKLYFDFDYFQTEFIYDTLQVYAHPYGKLLERMSGRTAPQALVDADSVYMTWTTDAANTDKGFYLKWRVSTCPVPTNPKYGNTVYAGLEKGDLATFECMTGYEIAKGAPSAVCQENGTWSVPTTDCTIKSCGDVAPLTNGRVISRETTYGSSVMYQCDPEYLLDGPKQRWCEADGTWSGKEPTCNVPDCGTIPTPAFGKKYGLDTVYRSTVRFTCLYGVQMVNGISGSLQRTCQVDGTWSGTEVKCIDPVQCDFENGFCGLRQGKVDTIDWLIDGQSGLRTAMVPTKPGGRVMTASLLSREFHPYASCYTLKMNYSTSGNGTLQVYKVDRAVFNKESTQLILNHTTSTKGQWVNGSWEVTTEPYSYTSFIFEATMNPSKQISFVRIDGIALLEGCKGRPTTILPTTQQPTTVKPSKTTEAVTFKLTTPKPTTIETKTFPPTKPEPTTQPPTKPEPTTMAPTKPERTTLSPTQPELTTEAPVEPKLTTQAPTEPELTTAAPTKPGPTTLAPTKPEPTTLAPTKPEPTTLAPTQPELTTEAPVEPELTTQAPTEPELTTEAPTKPEPTTLAPTKPEPTTLAPTQPELTTEAPVEPELTTQAPIEPELTTEAPTKPEPITLAPTKPEPTTLAPTKPEPTTLAPTAPPNSETTQATCSPQVVDMNNGDSVVAQSPGFGGNSYPTDMSCVWRTEHVGGNGYLAVKFTAFDLVPRDATGMCSDRVEVYSYSDEFDTSKTRIFCGVEGIQQTDYLVQRPTEIRIKFISDGTAESGHGGFQAGIVAMPSMV